LTRKVEKVFELEQNLYHDINAAGVSNTCSFFSMIFVSVQWQVLCNYLVMPLPFSETFIARIKMAV